MGVGPYFHGFTLDRVREKAVLCHNLPSSNKMNLLNSHCAGQRHFKDSSTVFLDSDIMCYNKVVAFPNKNNNKKKKKKIEICK